MTGLPARLLSKRPESSLSPYDLPVLVRLADRPPKRLRRRSTARARVRSIRAELRSTRRGSPRGRTPANPKRQRLPEPTHRREVKTARCGNQVDLPPVQPTTISAATPRRSRSATVAAAALSIAASSAARPSSFVVPHRCVDVPGIAKLPVEVLVSETRRAVDELSPGLQRPPENEVVDDVVDDPLHLRRFEQKDGLGGGQIRRVTLEAELGGIERRTALEQRLGCPVRAVFQPRDDHQSLHHSSSRADSVERPPQPLVAVPVVDVRERPHQCENGKSEDGNDESHHRDKREDGTDVGEHGPPPLLWPISCAAGGHAPSVRAPIRVTENYASLSGTSRPPRGHARCGIPAAARTARRGWRAAPCTLRSGQCPPIFSKGSSRAGGRRDTLRRSSVPPCGCTSRTGLARSPRSPRRSPKRAASWTRSTSSGSRTRKRCATSRSSRRTPSTSRASSTQSARWTASRSSMSLIDLPATPRGQARGHAED